MPLPAHYQHAHRFAFGDSPELADKLLALVISGEKTATCGAARDYDDPQEVMPVVDEHVIVLDGRQKPACVIRTVGVERLRFCDVTEDFALSEGEGSFADWRAGHIAFFERNGGWTQDLDLICERFKLVEVID